jgi:hypothetical protein
MHFSAPDHFCQRQPQLRGAHRARKRHEHLAALVDVTRIHPRVDQRRRVEMSIVMANDSLILAIKSPGGEAQAYGHLLRQTM